MLSPPGNFVPSKVITSPREYVLPPPVTDTVSILPLPSVTNVNVAPDPPVGATVDCVTPVVVVVGVNVPLPAG